MTLRTPRPIPRLPRLPRKLLAARALVPLTLLSFVTAPVPAAHAQEQLWITQFGTGTSDQAYALAPDGAGGVMVAGWTRGSLGGPNAGRADVFLARFAESCYADCDQSGVLDIFDFLCFQNSFVNGEPYACDCDPNPACDIFDFLCFQNAFVAGCP